MPSLPPLKKKCEASRSLHWALLLWMAVTPAVAVKTLPLRSHGTSQSSRPEGAPAAAFTETPPSTAAAPAPALQSPVPPPFLLPLPPPLPLVHLISPKCVKYFVISFKESLVCIRVFLVMFFVNTKFYTILQVECSSYVPWLSCSFGCQICYHVTVHFIAGSLLVNIFPISCRLEIVKQIAYKKVTIRY